jgi:putative heme-binding domain-containing protein
LPLLVWYGLTPLAQADPEALVGVAAACQWDVTVELIARRLAESIDDDPAPLNRLLSASARSRTAAALPVLRGMRDALRGWQRAPRPDAWDELQKAVENEDQLPQRHEIHELLRELSAVFGDGRALDEIRRIALDDDAPFDARQAALRTLIQSRPAELREVCRRLLQVPHLNVTAAQGLAHFDDPAIATLLIERYRRFRLQDRPQVISILVSRPAFARALMTAVAQGNIPRDDVSAFQIQQLLNLGDLQLAVQVTEAWGIVRESSDEKRQRIAELKTWLNDGRVASGEELSKGRALFERHCSNCHRLYGQGDSIGPDLTGSGRHDLDFLLHNLVDPSAVVDANYRMKIVTTHDGRVIQGLIRLQTDRTITVQTQTESVTLERTAIEQLEQTSLSPMPDGLLDQLSAEQVRALIAYLRHPVQVPGLAEPLP